MKRKYVLKDMVGLLGKDARISGNKKFSFSEVKPINSANRNSLTWLNPSHPDKIRLLSRCKASAVICSTHDVNIGGYDGTLIAVRNPKLAFIRVIKKLFCAREESGIHPTSVIHPMAKIGKHVFIGAHCIIGKATIGEFTVIQPGTVIYDKVRIGKNGWIGANSVIGSMGFGFSKNRKGRHERFPHIGGVIIGDDVEIGANTCIDRGALGYTIIKRGCKIDNLVHVAHNTIIGEETIIIANAMIGGSTVIGKNSWIAPSASLRDAIVIGDNVLIGVASNVTKNIPSNQVWAGNPAKEFKTSVKSE